MKHSLITSWKGKMKFNAEINGHNLVMDAPSEFGGNNEGPRPKELMLASLAGCSGMDVVSLLEKMRVEITAFNIIVDADITEEHPKHYTKMHIIYEFKGNDLPIDKLQKAVELSQERYCGVSFMYKKAFELTHEIRVVNN